MTQPSIEVMFLDLEVSQKHDLILVRPFHHFWSSLKQPEETDNIRLHQVILWRYKVLVGHLGFILLLTLLLSFFPLFDHFKICKLLLQLCLQSQNLFL